MAKRVDKRVIWIVCAIGAAVIAIVGTAVWSSGLLNFGASGGKKADLKMALWLSIPAAILVLPFIVYAMRRALARVRVRRAIHPCPECGYELRGIVSKVCPECGTER